MSLIDLVLTTNENLIADCVVANSEVSGHSLVSSISKLKASKPRPSYVTTRSYKNYKPEAFLDDLARVSFYVANIFDNFDDRVDVFNTLFLDTLNNHAPLKRIKIKSRSHPFITSEIKKLIETRDNWHKLAFRSKDKLY